MLGSTIRRMIAPVLRECPRECGVVSITRVVMSADASYATIYISALQAPEKAIAFLDEERSVLQRSLGDLQRARIPMLRFRLDDAVRESNRVDELLRRAEEDSK